MFGYTAHLPEIDKDVFINFARKCCKYFRIVLIYKIFKFTTKLGLSQFTLTIGKGAKGLGFLFGDVTLYFTMISIDARDTFSVMKGKDFENFIKTSKTISGKSQWNRCENFHF